MARHSQCLVDAHLPMIATSEIGVTLSCIIFLVERHIHFNLSGIKCCDTLIRYSLAKHYRVIDFKVHPKWRGGFMGTNNVVFQAP